MRYAVFLRAINVGKHNRITMDALRALIEPLGYSNVKTYLQSGNLALDADEPPARVTQRVEQALVDGGLRNASALVRTQAELLDLLSSKPFRGYRPTEFRHYVTFLGAPLPDIAIAAISMGPWLVAARPLELLTVNEIGMPNPNFNTMINKDFGTASTTRYWHVVQAVTALLEPGERPSTSRP